MGTFAGWVLAIATPFMMGFPLIVIGIVWIANRCTEYTVTNQRIKLQKGIIFRRADEIELYRIKDVKVDYSLLNQMFDIGIITLVSSDPTTKGGQLQMRYVVKAREIREMLRNVVEQSRRRRGVREVDIDPMPYQS